jgi:hypothetical protein
MLKIIIKIQCRGGAVVKKKVTTKYYSTSNHLKGMIASELASPPI